MRFAPVLLLALAGCLSLPLPHARGQGAASVSRKVVSGKHAPRELVARDGTSCITTEARFRRTQPGDPVWCMWHVVGTSTAAMN